jgi:hypothetical protein
MGLKNLFVSRTKLFLESEKIPFNSKNDYPGQLV